jgi:DNA polymerase-3 subunit delta'
MNIYPWQKHSWVEVFSNEAKMPHANIFYGSQALEINKFVGELIKSVLCSQPTKEHFACKECQDCLWTETSHPDLKVVERSSDKDEKLNSDILNIANAREVKKFLELTSHQANGKKIVVIYDAERLNVAASNALLKTIEEPPNNCLIILTVNNLANLLPTITSRCRLISLTNPSKEDAKNFLEDTNNADLISRLELYNNSPLQLISEKEMLADISIVLDELKKGDAVDLMKVNNIWLNNGLAWIINLLQKWSYEILLYKLSEEHTYFPDDIKVIHKLALNADLSKLLTYQKSLNTIKSYAQKSVNKEINLNSVMIEYKNIFTN